MVFRHSLHAPDWYLDSQVANFLIKQCVCIHLDNNNDKFDILVYMTQKLFALAKGKCAVESCDNPMFQEVLLAGHLYQQTLKEKIEFWLKSLKRAIVEEVAKVSKGKGFNVPVDLAIVTKAFTKCGDITVPMESVLATGAIKNTETGLGLMQHAGLTVVADKLNFCRFLSHFRCIHRGSFFTEMRTTAVRKLLPEAWGFLCPVHTPDGGPCGLLNHATALCKIVNKLIDTRQIPRLLCMLGMVPYDEDGLTSMLTSQNSYTVLLDGRVIGKVKDDDSRRFVDALRLLKVSESEGLSSMMEICLVPKTPAASQYPGIYLFTSMARLMRPVINCTVQSIEMVGTFEQVYLNICVSPEEAYKGVTTHQEIVPHAMLSDMAILTPFSDYNQSPRNMYQCQMGKQTMGTPLHAITHRSDNKLYRIQTPQSPIVRPYLHDDLDMDNYPLGTNAIVAVISYTGYDMEDAMVLNKASCERGFGHGSIYKGQFIDLKDLSSKHGVDVNKLEFGRIPNIADYKQGHGRLAMKLDQLDLDGLPFVGAYLEEGDAFYSYYNAESHSFNAITYNGSEPAYVDQVKMLFDDINEKKFRVGDVTARTDRLQRVFIMLRIPRNPSIGDKFSSRHGQKGICSRKVPMEDMPFTESGMTPDIIFNPHGFPSRMTIGMLIEFMAGKAAALHGCCYDATPFTYSEEKDPISYFGECLKQAGYNYYGTERMYSGTDGREMEVDVFIGVVYYQRLRHMVYDKYQVRTTGPYDQITKQPVHGRKKGGGIRLGEMERDAIISHGASFLLQDRLFNCSDGSEVRACTKCGSILSPVLDKPAEMAEAASATVTRRWRCRMCGEADTVVKIRIPQVFTYLVAELASVNIATCLSIKSD
jgi:DNA-directed RNA polymerase I subunit RPA2